MRNHPVIISILILLMINGCMVNAPIKIGFVGTLIGKASDLSVAGRNGAILAVEEINQTGGINGRPVELLIRDDRDDPETAVAVDRELIDQGVAAIIGHVSNSMTIAALPLINQTKTLMISPASSSNKLTNLDDFFFRIQPPNQAATALQANNIFNREKIKKLAVIYDLSNKSYTEDWLANFKVAYYNLGGIINKEIFYFSGPSISFIKLIEKAEVHQSDGILIVASAMDSAMFCQQLWKLKLTKPVFASGWAMTNDLIQRGGPAVEGLTLPHSFDAASTNPAYLRFKKTYTARFGEPPIQSAAFSYEATQVLFKAIKNTKKVNGRSLKETILKLKVFDGLQASFEFNKFGDPIRKHFLFMIKDGTFVRIDG